MPLAPAAESLVQRRSGESVHAGQSLPPAKRLPPPVSGQKRAVTMKLPWRPATMLTLLVTAQPGLGVDLAKVDRTIAKQPAYHTKAPKYGLLVFGPEAKSRAWVVLDGDFLYVDRNCNGDLTEAGERLLLKKKWEL